MSGPIIETTHGRLRGVCVGGADVFKGVPYAETTAGANRFRPPQPLKPWGGVRDALAWGHSAPQAEVPTRRDPFFSWYFETEALSEDCLSLNVFTPSTGADKRPIMVWIHGGGWREGAGSASGFDGMRLAEAQDVVVITLNHRLNGFGFLDLGREDERFADAGNAGLLDIVAALRWVRGNAAAFGGDADNVTLFGESGGGSKICALLAMKAAHGLFHKAIIQSSAGGMSLATPDEAAQAASDLAHTLGVARLDGEALQKLPMTSLIDALAKTPHTFRGTLDGRNFTAHPFLDAAPSMSTNVPILAGFTATEATFYLRGHEATFDIGWPDVARRLARIMLVAQERASDILNAYRRAYPTLGPCDVLVTFATDHVFRRNNLHMMSLQSTKAKAPVYLYQFERRSPIEGGRYGAPHTSEIPFVFGTADAAVGTIGGGADIVPLTNIMMSTWAAFARTGNPNSEHLPHWSPFTPDAQSTMLLNVESRHVTELPGGAARAVLQDLPFCGYANPLWAIARDHK